MRSWLVFLVGCEAGSAWERTQSICAFEPTQVTAESFALPPAYPSEECAETVLEDFGYHPDAVSDEQAVQRLLWAAHALLTADLGDTDELDGAWASRPFREALLPSSPAPTNARLYDYVTSRVDVTLPGSRSDAAAGLQGDTLFLYDLPPGIDGAAVLVHEARHRDGAEHVPCGGEPVCDEDTLGAWGFELAVHELARDHSADDLARQIEESWMEALPERIVGR